MSKRIIFVDDEPQILQGLRDRLRHQRKKWDMSFIESGREALELMERELFDVIVTDMRMPEMDGAMLLRRVRDAHPGVVRIVLSGHAEEGAMLKAMALAHQFISKPCDPGVIENIIERVCAFQMLIGDEAIRQAVGRIGCLPSAPKVYTNLMAALANEDSNADMVTHILKQDPSMCAQVLHVVNSAYFNLARNIIKVEDAVVYLGFEIIRQLVLATEVFRQAGDTTAPTLLSIDKLQKHSMLTASIAASFFKRGEQRDTAFIAGMLHDIGMVLLATELTSRFQEMVLEMRTEGGSMHVIEERRYGISHAEIGGYLLGLWQIPFPIVEAVTNHHMPSRVEQLEFDIPTAIHVADALANELQEPVIHGAKDYRIDLDLAYLEKLGVANKLDEWRDMAKEIARSQCAKPKS